MVVVSNGTLLIVDAASGCIRFVELTEEVYAAGAGRALAHVGTDRGGGGKV